MQLAAHEAVRRVDCRTFRIGAVGVRTDGALVFACNGPTTFPDRCAHAEYRLSRKLEPQFAGVVLTMTRELAKCGSLRSINTENSTFLADTTEDNNVL